jgi:hypothetical protein
MAIASNVPMATINERRLQDAQYKVLIAGPAANANTNTAALDLLQASYQAGMTAANGAINRTGPFPVTERVWVNIAITAGVNTTNSKNVNIYLEHANGYAANGAVNTSDYINVCNSAVGGLPVLMVTDNASAGFSAASVNLILPPDVKRYIRCKVALEANGNTSADTNTTLALLF